MRHTDLRAGTGVDRSRVSNTAPQVEKPSSNGERVAQPYPLSVHFFFTQRITAFAAASFRDFPRVPSRIAGCYCYLSSPLLDPREVVVQPLSPVVRPSPSLKFIAIRHSNSHWNDPNARSNRPIRSALVANVADSSPVSARHFPPPLERPGSRLSVAFIRPTSAAPRFSLVGLYAVAGRFDSATTFTARRYAAQPRRYATEHEFIANRYGRRPQRNTQKLCFRR